MSIYNIINSVAQIGSTIAKQKILEDNKDNEILKKCFLYAENPRFNYYIKIDAANLMPDTNGSFDIDDIVFAALDKLINREITGNRARNYVIGMMMSLTPEAAIILARIINRDLRCNAGTAIANKVWKNLIPEYPVLLCDKFNSKTEKHLKKFENNCGFWVELKEDGGRLLVTVDNDGVVTYRSRNGSVLNLFGVFDTHLAPHHGKVFDGELIVVNPDGKPDRKTGNGFYTKAVRGTLTEEEAKKFSYRLWDMITLDEYESGVSQEPYSVRREKITDIGFTGIVSQVYGEKVDTLDECFDFYTRMRSDGQEGAIIKVATAPWEDTRSKNYIKLKNESTGDFLVVDVELGTGKYSDMIGALVCESSCGNVRFGVGTGFNDKDRALDHASYLGKIVEVSYNEVISSRDRETKSLFLPVFKQIRHDKTIANSLAELK